MNALRRTGLSEVFAERRTSIGVLVTLAIPVAVLGFLAAATIGQFGSFLILLTPTVIVVASVAAVFLYAVSSSAFSAATMRRRRRYEALSAMGAQRRHFARLLIWELGVPAVVGVGLGTIIGVAAGEIINPFAVEFDSSENVGPAWVGLLSSGLIVAAPALAGAWAAARTSAAQVGQPRPASTGSWAAIDLKQLRKRGIWTLAVSTLLLSFSLLDQAWFGLVFGVIGVLIGASMLLPVAFSWLAARFSERSAATSALRGLADNPRRAMGFAGAIMTLTALTVMAAAGIMSDQGINDGPGDRRQVSVEAPFPVRMEAVEQVGLRHDNAMIGWASYDDSGGKFVDGRSVTEPGFSSSIVAAELTDELITLLELEPEDVDFARSGGVLVDSDVMDEVVVRSGRDADGFDEFEAWETRRIRRGGGIRQPGPVAYVIDPDRFDGSDPVLDPALVRFAQPISAEMALDFREINAQVDVPRDGDNPWVIFLLTGLAGAVLFSMTLAGSNLAAVELDEEFSTLVALGASPSIRPRILALQMAYQLALGVGLGSALGVGLFWFVTRGDVSVPNAVVPAEAIGILAVAAVLATLVIAAAHGSATLNTSSKVSALAR